MIDQARNIQDETWKIESATVNLNLPAITLNVNKLNTSIKN